MCDKKYTTYQINSYFLQTGTDVSSYTLEILLLTVFVNDQLHLEMNVLTLSAVHCNTKDNGPRQVLLLERGKTLQYFNKQ